MRGPQRLGINVDVAAESVAGMNVCVKPLPLNAVIENVYNVVGSVRTVVIQGSSKVAVNESVAAETPG
jgi:hypothetical protein